MQIININNCAINNETSKYNKNKEYKKFGENNIRVWILHNIYKIWIEWD